MISWAVAWATVQLNDPMGIPFILLAGFLDLFLAASVVDAWIINKSKGG